MAKDRLGEELKVGDQVLVLATVGSVGDDGTVIVDIPRGGSANSESSDCYKLGRLKLESLESLVRATEGAKRGASGLTKPEH